MRERQRFPGERKNIGHKGKMQGSPNIDIPYSSTVLGINCWILT